MSASCRQSDHHALEGARLVSDSRFSGCLYSVFTGTTVPMGSRRGDRILQHLESSASHIPYDRRNTTPNRVDASVHYLKTRLNHAKINPIQAPVIAPSSKEMA